MSDTNVIPFERNPRQGLGYKPPPTTGDWLSEMPDGTRFLGKPKTDPSSRFTEYVVCCKVQGVVLLAEKTRGGGVLDWHDPELFCQDVKYHCTLEITELPNGNSNILQPPRVESHGVDQDSD